MQDTGGLRPDQPTAFRLFLIFSRIGLTSFGGGVSGWLLREFVQDRHWITEEEFLNGLALSQALPGVNVKNMAIWIGYRLLGSRGALAGFAGIIVPPAVFIVLLGVGFSSLSQFALTHIALDGAAAAAIGLSLSMGITAARRVPRRAIPIGMMLATFAAVGLLQRPLVWVVLGGGSASVALEYCDCASCSGVKNPLLGLVAVFVPLSFVTVGGGQAVVADIQRQVVDVHHWMTSTDFVNAFAISRMAPGPGSLLVTLIGWQVAGFWGAVVATIGIFGPTAVLIYGVAHLWSRYKGARWQSALEGGLRPVAAGMILAAVYVLLQALDGGWLARFIAFASTGALMLTRINPLLLLACGAGVFIAGSLIGAA